MLSKEERLERIRFKEFLDSVAHEDFYRVRYEHLIGDHWYPSGIQTNSKEIASQIYQEIISKNHLFKNVKFIAPVSIKEIKTSTAFPQRDRKIESYIDNYFR